MTITPMNAGGPMPPCEECGEESTRPPAGWVDLYPLCAACRDADYIEDEEAEDES